ncbi:LCP family protein [Clostridium cellulovorans]|uniref:Cell envelope-related transcriptional attenuator n=1 Tax=Clostridium cellulovorans (strain ATCC 35296 / DSM 3052 / OCM 3 / 743B) TaxID=573061 RepID=D9SVD3_CLOC7|nr:LCP family protein [Clostridium cellulovorans]ADL51057.1 cell envelope-related transcriptional attenuator [Clostridium cellulovorans 743B]
MESRTSRIKKRKKKKALKITIIAIVSILIFIIGIVVSFAYTKLNQVNRVAISNNDLDLGITDDVKSLLDNKFVDENTGKEVPYHSVQNILLTGIDHVENATDTMIVVSIDKTANKIKMTSIYRDTYIENTPEGQVPKLNYAHKYGGIQNTVKVINENFKLDIRDYVNVDVQGFFNVVDSIGGVTLNVPTEDVWAINKKIDFICENDYPSADPSSNYLSQGGPQELNTIQTIAYVRYRTSSGDYARTDRNRAFMEAVLNKIISMPISQYLSLYDSISQYFETTLSSMDLINLVKSAISYAPNGIAQSAFPYDAETIFVNGWNYFGWDQPSNIEKIHEFIYK